MPQSLNEIIEQEAWILGEEELALLPGMTDKGRLGFAIQLKFRQVRSRYPEHLDEIDPQVAQWIADQIGTSIMTLPAYELHSRQGQRHRQAIRRYLGYRLPNGSDLKRLSAWLVDDVLPFDPQARHGRELAYDWCNNQRLEPPAIDYLDRVIRSAVRRYETQQQAAISARLSAANKIAIDRLLGGEEADSDDTSAEEPADISFSKLKTDPGRASLDSLLGAIAKLKCISDIGLTPEIFENVPAKFIDQFRQRCATESIRELRRHPVAIRYSMVAMFCWRRQQQLTDALVDLLMQIIHNLGARAEKRTDKRQFAAFKKVRGKAKLLFKLAEATVGYRKDSFLCTAEHKQDYALFLIMRSKLVMIGLSFASLVANNIICCT